MTVRPIFRWTPGVPSGPARSGLAVQGPFHCGFSLHGFPTTPACSE